MVISVCALLLKHPLKRLRLLAGSILPCCCGCQCKPKDGWYDKFFASVMATGMDAYEEAVTPFKFELLRGARFQGGGEQSLLEIGIGAAPNLQYLTRASFQQVDGLRVTGMDPNPYMFDYAQASAERAGLPNDHLELKLAAAEQIPAQDASFDTVICTLVLCSVPNVQKSVREMRRVLKPGGKLYFLEHVAANPEEPLLRAAQYFLTPVQQLLADGCHLNRDPLQSITSAGFAKIESRRFKAWEVLPMLSDGLSRALGNFAQAEDFASAFLASVSVSFNACSTTALASFKLLNLAVLIA